MRLQSAVGWDKLSKRGTHRCARQESQADDTARFHQAWGCFTFRLSARGNRPAVDPRYRGAISGGSTSTVQFQHLRRLLARYARARLCGRKELFHRMAICRRRLRAPPRIGERSRQVESQHHIRNEYAIDSAASKATRTIPIVMGFYEDDPTEYGVAAGLGRPGGNVTGLAAMEVESLSKHLDLIHAMLPDLNQLGILINPSVGPTVRPCRKCSRRQQRPA